MFPGGNRRLPRRGRPERPGETTSTIPLGRTDDDLGDDLYPDSASFGALPPGSALLLVMRGPNAGSRFRLDGELTTAGRHPDSDIFLDDVTVSRRHAEFYRSGARFTVRDVGSLNGTYVNRERIEEAELTGGDEVQIGKFRLLFLTSQDLPARRRPPTAGRGRPGLHVQRADGARPVRHRRGARSAPAGIPGHQHVQDPVPGGRRADRATRSRSGYRRFSRGRHRAAGGIILTMQRDSYPPLRVIRERLADGAGASRWPVPGGPSRRPT